MSQISSFVRVGLSPAPNRLLRAMSYPVIVMQAVTMTNASLSDTNEEHYGRKTAT
jgi:hypothetical protein